MNRPKLSLMGIQSGEHYLKNFINEQSAYIDELEKELEQAENLLSVSEERL